MVLQTHTNTYKQNQQDKISVGYTNKAKEAYQTIKSHSGYISQRLIARANTTTNNKQ